MRIQEKLPSAGCNLVRLRDLGGVDRDTGHGIDAGYARHHVDGQHHHIGQRREPCQITGLSDVTFTNIDPATAASAAQNNCVWSNTATKGYSITATGSGTSGAFTLANGPLTVPYSVQWSQTSGQSTGTALTAGTALTGLATTAANPTCSTSPSTTSSLVVTISAPSLQSMVSATTYTGSLTLLVTPQ